MAMSYGHVYVAQVAFGAKDAQTVKAFLEAESYQGPSLIIAYSHCIAHGYDMAQGLEHQQLATDERLLAALPLRPAPRGARPAVARARFGAPTADVGKLMAVEARFQLTDQQDHAHYEVLIDQARRQINKRVALYQEIAHRAAAIPTAGR